MVRFVVGFVSVFNVRLKVVLLIYTLHNRFLECSQLWFESWILFIHFTISSVGVFGFWLESWVYLYTWRLVSWVFSIL